MVSLHKQLDQAVLSLHSSFKFHCHNELACFNQCCRTPTIILSPYDILRLKSYLGLTSGEFLQRYTRQELEESANLPLVFLDAYRAPVSSCPFLGATGCEVYPHRPAACRLFPITMGSRLTEQGVVDYYFCRKLEYCQGFAADVQWTVESWKTNQEFADYEEGRRLWLEIILQQGLKGSPALDFRVQDLFATLAYDLDTFRRLICEPVFLQACNLNDKALEDLRMSDLALLNFSYRCLRAVLSGEEPGLMKAAMRGLYRISSRRHGST